MIAAPVHVPEEATRAVPRASARCRADGQHVQGIAHKLFISPQTVQTHVRNLLAKLGVHSKLEAVGFAVKHGLISI
jgi:two-component system, NarL family, response regulator LiaR